MNVGLGATPSCFDLYFVGQINDPRNMQVIGYEGSNPILYSFDTVTYGTQTRTSICRGAGEMLAYFDWTNTTHMGLCVIGAHQKFAMALLVGTGSTSFSRRFRHKNSYFEWRRISNDSYDLFSADNVRLALFRSKLQSTPVGEAYGYMQYGFQAQDGLLLEALLALCVNRWIDKHGF